MSRITDLFNKKSSNVLNVYCTAGFPKLDSTIEVMKVLQKSGADMIELGMPYSDPLADGPVIQASSATAIRNGMTIKKLFEDLRDFRKQVQIPVILMGYMNPILQYGFEKFCGEAEKAGIDGLILPDLPEHEFETEYGEIIKKHNLDFIFLVTPETSRERIQKLDSLSTGFLYAVSSSSTTGKEKNMNAVSEYLLRLKNMKLKNPVLVGFGIKDRQTFASACENAAGAIVGTAYISALQNADNVEEATEKFIKQLR